MSRNHSFKRQLELMTDKQLNDEFEFMKETRQSGENLGSDDDEPFGYPDASTKGEYRDKIYEEMIRRGMYNPDRGRRTIVRRCS